MGRGEGDVQRPCRKAAVGNSLTRAERTVGAVARKLLCRQKHDEATAAVWERLCLSLKKASGIVLHVKHHHHHPSVGERVSPLTRRLIRLLMPTSNNLPLPPRAQMHCAGGTDALCLCRSGVMSFGTAGSFILTRLAFVLKTSSNNSQSPPRCSGGFQC